MSSDTASNAGVADFGCFVSVTEPVRPSEPSAYSQ
jgi:hypothetical protein